jgi:cohesin complex subunit SCC1
MFYSQYILARKGPLGKIWLAAHFEKKLTKSQVFATDITESVNSIVNPTVPLALRVSGHLMLGIVRIYSDKVRYLSSDCRDAMTRINLAFKGQTNRVDIEEAAGGKIDDANYALLPMDEDDQSAQIAFRRKVVRSIPKLDESDVTSFFAVGEIELLRHDLSRPSIQSRRSTATLDISRRSLDQKLEDDVLPAFDAHIGDSLYNTSNFELFEPFEVPKESEAIQKERQQSLEFFPPVTPDAGEQFDFAPVQSTTIKAKSSKTKRRKVEINEQVEIPDKQWKQRLVDVNAIVREPRALLGSEPHTGFRENFEDITGSLHYCPELSNLIDVFSDHRAESFAFLQHLQKNIEIIPENILEPELARRQSGLEVNSFSLVLIQLLTLCLLIFICRFQLMRKACEKR